MNLTEIRKLIKIFEKSKIGELEIVEDNHKIRMSRNHPEQNSTHVNGGGTTYVWPSTQNIPGQGVPEQPRVQEGITNTKTEEAKSADNYFEVRAPMVGTFYNSPAPDADPYVKLGDQVSNGQTLCIIEAMKLMNEIQSETDGKIVKILAENAQPVEYNQVLFLVDRG